MSSRLAYAIGFRAVRDVLVLDEVFAVGDAGFKKRCEDRYRQLHALGHTVLLVSHTVPVVTEFCDRAILIDRGRVCYEGTGEDTAHQYHRLLTTEGGSSTEANAVAPVDHITRMLRPERKRQANP